MTARELMTRIDKGCGARTRYTYNIMNEMTGIASEKDGGSINTTIAYDMAEEGSINNPDTGEIKFYYDNMGNLTQKETPELVSKGQSINYTYTYNRLDRINYPNMEDVYYTYGAAGSDTTGRARVETEQLTTGGVTTLKDEKKFGRLGETVEGDEREA